MRYLMWDIDGTLILTGGAGYDALVKVIKEYYHLDAFEFTKTLAGRTDSEIIKGVIMRLRGRPNIAEAASLMIRYHMALPAEMPRHPGRILKNVEAALKYFARPASRYENCILSGNTRTGSKIKLEYFGLYKYFNFNHSAFGEISECRDDIAKIAWQRFYLNDPAVSKNDLIIIGDTPNDARCAQAIGVRALIVLFGSRYKREDFVDVVPWKILDALPDDPAELEAMLDER